MKPIIIENEIFEFEPFEKDGSELIAAETPISIVYFVRDMKNKSHQKVALNGVVSIKSCSPHSAA